MFITGLGTAVPPQCYRQADCWAALQTAPQFQQLKPRSRAILKKVLTGRNGIATRHLALETLADGLVIEPDVLQARFLKHAPALAAQAAARALANSRTPPRAIDALIVSTCTGYLCPGLTSYVCERLGLRPDLLALDLVGQGCGAALPNLRTAEALLAANRCAHVLSVCVEVCSAAVYFDDDPGVLVSACLFADGAGAAVLASAPGHQRRVQWKTSASLLHPARRDLLRFEHRGGLLRNLLTPRVPAEAAACAEQVLDQVLRRAGVQRAQINAWLWHPGGRDVLLALRERLGLREPDFCWSTEILSEFGNVSSPSILFVLERALSRNAPGGWWWMSSFGAGFSCHGALLEVQEAA
jgi:predicted naringenin-chalcone synthase